ncbi:MAG: DUF1223 domain-containing protein [Alphaproteobacteria bacterium]|nr:DUF1223 domain-containing protein [Alphaproteobacteria bacterium]MDE2012171.1 DUF1223 domain-containing protein [Alphaproteobacteria bacterium]MDE2072184.1 DUF1223 domain-containing protein [Alphaproteobacteria bacterium]MDE2353163.1 DUF1223 domain-containing protein [Alphaproteobacteria bacterium]
MRAWLALAGLVVALGAGPVAARAGEAASPPARPVVVELYTSQGCSSCPPADAFLARLAERQDVLALTLPITYWDMLGWKDTLATGGNTARQKAYAAAMGRGGVYTPQMIVNGTSDVVGSREQAVDAAIQAHEAGEPDVPVTLKVEPAELRLTVGTGLAGRDDPSGWATIWLFRVRPQTTVKIGGGENSGRVVTYHNVVREVTAVGLWKGRPVTLDLPRSALGGGPGDSFAALVQDKGYGRVIGASWIVH